MDTLFAFFITVPFEVTRLPWRIYGNHSHKLLCADYGNMYSDDLDDLRVVHYSKRNGYWRIVVED